MLPNCEEFIPVWYGILKAGAVMSSINTAYKGDFLSWTINLVEAKKLIIADSYLDRLEFIAAELPHLESRHRVAQRGPRGPRAAPALGAPGGAPGGPRRRAGPRRTPGPTTRASCSPPAPPGAARA